MGRAPRELTPYASAAHRLGAELRHWRLTRRLTQSGLGHLTHHSAALVGKIEKAERRASLEFCKRVDEVLDTQGSLARIWRSMGPAEPSPCGHRDDFLIDDITDSSLGWADDGADAVERVCQLWKAEMDRRSMLTSTAWVAGAFSLPPGAWLPDHPGPPRRQSGRQIGRAEVDALWAMCESFTDADHRLGGGYARSTLIHYVNAVVRPMLRGGDYSGTIGYELMAATARLCDLCAFMSFDSAEHGLAQRYFILALRLAHASGNRALGAHILGDMSMQAHHLGDAGRALELATAAHDVGLKSGSPSTVSRCAALQGRAHSLRGDSGPAAKSRLLAETLLDRDAPDGEPPWIQFFTEEQLTAEAQYMAADLGQCKEVQRLAPTVLGASATMQRRRVLSAATLAKSYLPAEGSAGDLDRATDLLSSVLPALTFMTSARSHQHISEARRALAPHGNNPSVRDFHDRYEHMIVESTASTL